MKIRLFIALMCAFSVAYCSDNDGASTLTENASTARDSPPYINMILCPMQKEPWSCLREQSGRLLDLVDNSYKVKWSEFKDEANKEIIAKFQARGFSATDKVLEKTSTIFDKIETGVSDIKEFAESTANEYLGREDEDEQDEDFETDISFEEFTIDDDDDEKKKGDAGIKNKKKRKKKPHQGADITSLLHDDDESDDVELDADLLSGLGGAGGHGIKLPHKHGRSLGVTRGKKKKKKKAIMKIILIGSFLKAKIELLLKLLSAHLQIKFFAISVIGLLLNLIRFWLDIKRGHAPNKVIYYEHAHHQHHYDEHDDFDTGGGYWRRTNAASTEYGAGDGLDEVSPYSRIGRNDYLPSGQGSSSLSSSYSKNGPVRMAYSRQIPPGV